MHLKLILIVKMFLFSLIRLNKKVCNAHISVIDDGTIPFNRGSVNFDDEGVDGQKTYLVKEGVLTSYMHDRISARHYGIAPTGNGRRETFRNVPIPRMRATYMEPGKYERRGYYCFCETGNLRRSVYKRTGANRCG